SKPNMPDRPLSVCTPRNRSLTVSALRWPCLSPVSSSSRPRDKPSMSSWASARNSSFARSRSLPETTARPLHDLLLNAVHSCFERFEGERLGQIAVRAQGHRALAVALGGLGRDDQKGCVPVRLTAPNERDQL